MRWREQPTREVSGTAVIRWAGTGATGAVRRSSTWIAPSVVAVQPSAHMAGIATAHVQWCTAGLGSARARADPKAHPMMAPIRARSGKAVPAPRTSPATDPPTRAAPPASTRPGQSGAGEAGTGKASAAENQSSQVRRPARVWRVRSSSTASGDGARGQDRRHRRWSPGTSALGRGVCSGSGSGVALDVQLG